MEWLSENFVKILLIVPGIILALTVHEAAHAWSAYKLGDDTAKKMGRITLNPIRHLDPIGSLAFAVTAFMGVGFGWAKPVPVRYAVMKNVRLGIMLVSASGPLSNFLFALLLATIFTALANLGMFTSQNDIIIALFLKTIWINIILGCFNLLPIPPLDGSGVVTGFLPSQMALKYQKIQRYGTFILIALIIIPSVVPNAPNIIGALIVKPAQSIMGLFLMGL